MANEFDARIPPVLPYSDPLPAEEPPADQGWVSQAIDWHDGLFRSAGHYVADVLDPVVEAADQSVEQGWAAIRDWGDSGGALSYGASRYLSNSLGLSKTMAVDTYHGTKAAVGWAYEGLHYATFEAPHFLNLREWLSGENLDRLPNVAALADPEVWRSAGLAATADVRRDYADDRLDKVAGHVLGFEMTLVAGALALKGLLTARTVLPLVGETRPPLLPEGGDLPVPELGAGWPEAAEAGAADDLAAQLRPDETQLRFSQSTEGTAKPLKEMATELSDWQVERGLKPAGPPPEAARPPKAVQAEKLRQLIAQYSEDILKAGLKEDHLESIAPNSPRLDAHMKYSRDLDVRLRACEGELSQIEAELPQLRRLGTAPSLEDLAAQARQEELAPAATTPAAENAESIAPPTEEGVASQHSQDLLQAIRETWNWLNDRRRGP